jgi:hypothetical protein
MYRKVQWYTTNRKFTKFEFSGEEIKELRDLYNGMEKKGGHRKGLVPIINKYRRLTQEMLDNYTYERIHNEVMIKHHPELLLTREKPIVYIYKPSVKDESLYEEKYQIEKETDYKDVINKRL